MTIFYGYFVYGYFVYGYFFGTSIGDEYEDVVRTADG